MVAIKQFRDTDSFVSDAERERFVGIDEDMFQIFYGLEDICLSSRFITIIKHHANPCLGLEDRG